MVKRGKEFALLFVFLIFSTVLITNFISAADCNGYLNCGGITTDVQCRYGTGGVCTWTGSYCTNVAGKYCSDITYQYYCTSQIGCSWSGPVCSSGVCCVGGQIAGSGTSCNSDTRFICTSQQIQIQTRSQYCTGGGPDSCDTTWGSWTNQYVYNDCTTGGYTCTEGETHSSPFSCSCATGCSSYGYQCGTWTFCGSSTSCGTCPTYPNSVMTCGALINGPQYAGKCMVQSCTGNYGNCDNSPIDPNGCETPLGTNTNCAYCGNTCTSGNSCQNYVCAPTCVSETDSLFCKNGGNYRCGVWSSSDNCGDWKTVDCQLGYVYDGNPCTDDVCASNIPMYIPNHNACTSDGNACTTDVCSMGSCTHPAIDCNDGDSCTTDSCSGGTCSHTAINCDDGNSCTTDGCSSGSCYHNAIVCNDGNSCTSDSCSGGSCQYSPLTGSSCTSDGNACTNDICSSSGSCTHPAVDCNDGNACTTDSCSGGSCSHTAINCDDGNACTSDGCSSGSCYHNALTGNACTSDGNECTNDVCNSAGNCAHNALTGNSCSSDGKSCTDDYCSSSGVCTHPALTGDSCTDDGNDCTDDVCNSAGNCAHNAITSCVNNDGLCCGSCTYLNDNNCAQCSVNSDCNDGNPCTTDTCSGGSCNHNAISGCCTSSGQCNDGNACTTDLCSSNTCSHPTIGGCCTSSSQCDDSNVCTTNTCSGNTCSYPSISGCCTTASQCTGAGYCQGKTCSGNVCSYPSISSCINGDSCCPGSCNILNDNDCGAICGDNDVNQASEDCDGSDLNGQTCASRLGSGYTGTLSCSGTCHFITNSCSAPSTTHGNGIIESGEACDDGNTNNGDGCSSTSQIESGYTCSNEPSVCTPVTGTHGNGVIDGTEECDDGNTNNGDGCSSSGTIESGWTCSGEPSVCTPVTGTHGNGVIDGTEECDDGDTQNGDGCSSTGTIENGWTCTGEPSICTPIIHGNGVIEGSEECDDGNTNNGDGCSSTGTIESGYNCVGEPSICTPTSAIHGDGIITSPEECDDHNLVNGDGCSSTGTIENGWTCTGEPSVCTSLCQLTDAYWEETAVLAGDPIKLYVVGTNCDGRTISFTVMEKDSFLNPDDPVTTNPSSITYSPSDNYGIWTVEWQDDTDGGQTDPPEYYFTATVQGTSDSMTSSKSDEDMMQVYENLDVVCLGVDYCTNYNVKSFCNSDLCSIGRNDAPSTITCGTAFDNSTGCYDNTQCGCSWNNALGICGSNWKTISTCEGENLSIGTCAYSENSQDNCDDGMLTRSLISNWVWSVENPSHQDPLGKQAKCQNIDDTISCPASAQVPFFGMYQLVIVIAIIIIIYLIYFLRRKNSRHIRKHSRIKVKR